MRVFGTAAPLINRRAFHLAAVAALGAGAVGSPLALLAKEAWPDRPMRIVIGWSAGTLGDVSARLVLDRLQGRLGQPFVVENRPGAGSAIAAESVARSAPDGYTFLVTTPGLASAKFVLAKVSFDAFKDFTYVAPYATVPMAVLVNAKLPVTTMKDLVAYAKTRREQLLFGSYGVASTNNIMMQIMNKQLGIEMVHVPYKDASAMYSDLARGDVNLMLDGLGTQIPSLQAGTVKVLAVTTEARYRGLPDVPTVAETVLPGFHYASFFGFVAPRGLPQSVVDRFTRELHAVLDEPAVVKRLEEIFYVPATGISAATMRTWMQDAERDYENALRNGLIPKPA